MQLTINKRDRKPPDANLLLEAKSIGVKFGAYKRVDMKTLTFNTLLGKRHNNVFWALKNVSLSGYSGEIIGVIGFNGAGKTTLCKVISRLLKPDKGEITVNGEVSALLSLGTGFNKELTGKENIYLNGMMLGLSKKEIDNLYPDIVQFSGLGDFIDQPIKYYSKGMRARLGFSIAAMMEPEILVLDEALSTGDLEFMERAALKIKDIVYNAKVVVIVSHDINYISRNCTSAIWIEQGEVKAAGDPVSVCAKYRQAVDEKNIDQRKKSLPKFKKTWSSIGDKTAIEVYNLGVKFKLDHNKTLWALDNVNFTIKEKEIVGIIGPNGAGKSTLCRVLSGILKADKGFVKVNGEVSALLSLGAGFNNHLPGRDNIYLNGLMLGIPRKVINNLFDSIVEFAELERFIDTPVKYYSSGMVSRLGFSIASAMEPDIFIIDEALSAGDAAFYEKASERIQEMVNSSKAVIVVTHNMSFVERVCTRAIWLKNGKILFDGAPKKAVARYKEDVKIARTKK